jgi:hypothetical protein
MTSTIAAIFPAVLPATFMNIEHCVSLCLQAEGNQF